MYTYALVGYLDSETEKNFKSLWRDLSRKKSLNMAWKIKEEDHTLLLLIMII